MARWIELATVVVGVLLVTAAVALVPLLPEREYPTPQFRIVFPATFTDGATPEHEFAAGATFEFPFDVTEGNLSDILFSYTFDDAQTASDPDRFRVELVAPNGTVVGNPTLASTEVPRLDNSTNPPTYVSDNRSIVQAFSVNDRPIEALISAEPRSEAPEAALRRVAGEFAAGGQGTWVVRVTLEHAGGCPPPQLDLPRSAACSAANPVGVDPGNAFRITLWRTVHYSAALAPEST